MRKSAGGTQGTPLQNRDTVSENCAYELIAVRTKPWKPQLLEADCCVRCFDIAGNYL